MHCCIRGILDLSIIIAILHLVVSLHAWNKSHLLTHCVLSFNLEHLKQESFGHHFLYCVNMVLSYCKMLAVFVSGSGGWRSVFMSVWVTKELGTFCD